MLVVKLLLIGFSVTCSRYRTQVTPTPTFCYGRDEVGCFGVLPLHAELGISKLQPEAAAEGR